VWDLREIAFRDLGTVDRAEHKKAMEQAFLITDRYRSSRSRHAEKKAGVDEKNYKRTNTHRLFLRSFDAIVAAAVCTLTGKLYARIGGEAVRGDKIKCFVFYPFFDSTADL